jgi:KaiC/GvpD/RAD55 family RecA-like ATPase
MEEVYIADTKMENPNADQFIGTGIEKLDNLLEGGTPRGYTVLILGSPGSSIEILSKQIATTESVLYITTDETKEEIVEAMKRFKWKNDKIKIVDIASRYSEQILSGAEKRVNVYQQRSKIGIKELIEAGSSGLPSIENEKIDFLAVLSNSLNDNDCVKVIINSLDFFLNQYSSEDVIQTIKAAKISNTKNKGVLYIIMTKGIHGDVFEKKMEGISDCVLELEIIKQGSTFERFLSVKKMKNYAKKIGIARYGIDDDGFVLDMIERIM